MTSRSVPDAGQPEESSEKPIQELDDDFYDVA
jgi:hypothetical protein